MKKIIIILLILLSSASCASTHDHTPFTFVSDKIVVLIPDTATACHMDALNEAVEFYDTVWETEESAFEVYAESKGSSAWKNTNYRVIKISFSDDVVSLPSGADADGMARQNTLGFEPRWRGEIEIYPIRCRPSTYIHEFGHTFSLGHDDFTPNNYMWSTLPANTDGFSLRVGQIKQTKTFALTK